MQVRKYEQAKQTERSSSYFTPNEMLQCTLSFINITLANKGTKQGKF